MSPLIIVVFIALAVFGSVYMLKPSPRQQRLAELRLEAIKLGLQVKLETFKTNSKKLGVRDDITATRFSVLNRRLKVRPCVGVLCVRGGGSKKVWLKVGAGMIKLSPPILIDLRNC